VADGLAAAAAGYRLAVATPTFQPRTTGELRFTVLGPDGKAVTRFAATPRDPSPLHTVVVRRDAAGFQRLDPAMSPDGVWRTPLTVPAPGVWRAYVDMTPAAGAPRSCSTPTAMRGPFTPLRSRPGRQIGDWLRRTAIWCRVTVAGLRDGHRDGVGVSDLQPYLGAFGKLVLLRRRPRVRSVAPGRRRRPRARPRRPRGPALALPPRPHRRGYASSCSSGWPMSCTAGVHDRQAMTARSTSSIGA
jgi:hypothetical protein